MQLTLPNRWGNLKALRSVFNSTKNTRIVLIIMVFSIMPLFTQAQDSNVIRGWNPLEEAEFMFDVYYQIVKCSPDSPTEVHLWAFNEGGKVDAIGFTLTLKDEDGTELVHKVEKFEIGFGQSYKADCSYDDYPYLKFKFPEEMDLETMKIDITYNK